jgi:hypothetical protein
MATVTRYGVNLGALAGYREKLGLQWNEIAQIIGVDQSTLNRWRSAESTPRPMAGSRLAQMDELLQLLPRIFSGPDVARTWIREARPEMLGGEATPLEVMKTGRVDRVLTLLQLLARGG